MSAIPTTTASASLSYQQKKEAEAKLVSLGEQAMKSAGQPGCNPFLWLKENVTPLANAFRLDPTKEVYTKIMALVVPTTPNIETPKIPEAKQVEKLVVPPTVEGKK